MVQTQKIVSLDSIGLKFNRLCQRAYARVVIYIDISFRFRF